MDVTLQYIDLTDVAVFSARHAWASCDLVLRTLAVLLQANFADVQYNARNSAAPNSPRLIYCTVIIIHSTDFVVCLTSEIRCYTKNRHLSFERTDTRVSEVVSAQRLRADMEMAESSRQMCILSREVVCTTVSRTLRCSRREAHAAAPCGGPYEDYRSLSRRSKLIFFNPKFTELASQSGYEQATLLVEPKTAGKERYMNGNHELDVAAMDCPLGGLRARRLIIKSVISDRQAVKGRPRKSYADRIGGILKRANFKHPQPTSLREKIDD
ncbi:hypothetical protein EVAR_17747_1 [Eumeta japonica]|uniref:Uncharacterized protein n=1 Tax=Eumeta variegata TaxID=151549 RepID=A0A4C1TTA6_EUMVA|nr:hypothetical protein EVAR_17747_1 [Eumeta japonica]